jgi:hypothetical protein
MPFSLWNRNTVLHRLAVGVLFVGLTMSGVGWAQTYPAIGELSADMPEGYDIVRRGADEFVFHRFYPCNDDE